jgi:hypothetical protein
MRITAGSKAGHALAGITLVSDEMDDVLASASAVVVTVASLLVVTVSLLVEGVDERGFCKTRAARNSLLAIDDISNITSLNSRVE